MTDLVFGCALNISIISGAMTSFIVGPMTAKCFEEFKNVLGQDKDRLTEKYEAAYDSGGPEKMRFYMNWSISNLSIIFTETRYRPPMTDEEKIDHRNSLRLI
jgi:hypothetical protein